MEWFLYNGDLRYKRVNKHVFKRIENPFKTHDNDFCLEGLQSIEVAWQLLVDPYETKIHFKSF